MSGSPTTAHAARSRPGTEPSATYAEILPSADLRATVECYWTIRADRRLDGVQSTRVVPDGCTDFIFNLGDPPLPDGVPHHDLTAYFVGAMRRPLLVRMTGRIDLIGVRLRPGAGGALLPLPAAELTDRAVGLDDVLRRRAGSAALDALAGEPTTAGRVRIVEMLLRRQLADAQPPHAAVRAALDRIERTGGNVRVRELEQEIGLSARQLQRLFARFVGVTPKTTCRVARFRHARRRLRHSPRASLAAVAHRCGYADQAHFTREFHEFAGITPGAWRTPREQSTHGVPHRP